MVVQINLADLGQAGVAIPNVFEEVLREDHGAFEFGDSLSHDGEKPRRVGDRAVGIEFAPFFERVDRSAQEPVDGRV
ncbi:MAG: hypothetical protein P1P76_06430 [Anaerolineales bacterium]|nr:hypothetical protein [Anaerolineales bacterium]